MFKRKNSIFLKNLFLIFFGFTLGVTIIWPGLIRNKGRNCFFKIIKDGSDGSVSLNTIISINPNYLFKINSAKNQYLKLLLIGDYCFRNK